MHDAFAMRVPQRVRNQRDGRQRLRVRSPGERTQVGAVNKLLAVKRVVVVGMKFEYAHDVRVHQADLQLPFGPQPLDVSRDSRHDLERHGGTAQTVFCQPGLRLTTPAEAAFEGVSVG